MHCSPKESTGEGREFGKTTSDDVFLFMSDLISDNGLKGFFQYLNRTIGLLIFSTRNQSPCDTSSNLSHFIFLTDGVQV